MPTDDLLQTIESPADPEHATVEHSLAITLTVRDSTGHKHPIHGAVCGHSALALRDPEHEDVHVLTRQTAERQWHLKAPPGFAVDLSYNLVRREFVRDMSNLRESSCGSLASFG